jgi:hypothetical protein
MAVVPDRNANGTVSAKVTKAIAWFLVQYQLKPMATAAYPIYYFRNSKGEEVQANVSDILDAYEAHKAEYKRANKSKAQAARPSA